MIRPLGVPVVPCPYCHGEATRYVSGPSWGYWGGSDVEYADCPACDGHGAVDPDTAQSIREAYRFDADGCLISYTED